MALKLGTENKRQVYIAVGLFAVVIIGGIYEISTYFGGSSTPPPKPIPVQTAATANRPAAGTKSAGQGAEAQKLTNEGLDPTLHFDKLAQSEDVEYSGSGRTIFSAESVPIAIPKPIAPVRPNGPVAAQNLPPAPPKPPSIDLRYFGYSQDEHKQLKAFFMHGDDIFMARTGDIVDHRYKIGVIRPLNVEVTDLAYNNTQTIQISQ